MPNLEKLNLRGTEVTDEGIKHFAKLTRLKELDVGETYISTEGMKKLRETLPGCKIHKMQPLEYFWEPD